MNKFFFIKKLFQIYYVFNPTMQPNKENLAKKNAAVVTKESNRLQPEALNTEWNEACVFVPKNIAGLQNFVATQPFIDLIQTSFRRYA